MPKIISDQFRNFTADDVRAIRKTYKDFVRRDVKQNIKDANKDLMKCHDINSAQVFAIVSLPDAGVSDKNIALGLPKLSLKFYKTIGDVCRLFSVDPKDI